MFDVLFLTGPDRPARPQNRDAQRVAVDGVETGQHRTRPVDLVAPDPYHRVADPVLEGEPEHLQVQFSAPDVADEILGRVPEVALELTPVDVDVGPRLQPDRQVAPSRSQVLREMLHVPGEAATEQKTAGQALVPCNDTPGVAGRPAYVVRP